MHSASAAAFVRRQAAALGHHPRALVRGSGAVPARHGRVPGRAPVSASSFRAQAARGGGGRAATARPHTGCGSGCGSAHAVRLLQQCMLHFASARAAPAVLVYSRRSHMLLTHAAPWHDVRQYITWPHNARAHTVQASRLSCVPASLTRTRAWLRLWLRRWRRRSATPSRQPTCASCRRRSRRPATTARPATSFLQRCGTRRVLGSAAP